VLQQSLKVQAHVFPRQKLHFSRNTTRPMQREWN
jgi:hypothetical protein